MAVQGNPLLQQAFAEQKALDTTSIDHTAFGKELDSLSTEIDKINAKNFEDFKYFSGQQEKLLGNLDLDLSQVNSAHRDDFRKRRLGQVEKMIELGTMGATSSLDFNVANKQLAADVAVSKQANEYANLLEKQMNEKVDFNTTANREKVKQLREASVEDLYKIDMPILTPVKAHKFSEVVTDFYSVRKQKNASIYKDENYFGVQKEEGYADAEEQEAIAYIKLKQDEYGNRFEDYVLDQYKAAFNTENPTQEDANKWYAKELIAAKPPSSNELTGVKERDYGKSNEGMALEQANKLELQQLKNDGKASSSSSSDAADMKANIRQTVDELDNKVRPISSKSLADLGIVEALNDIGIVMPNAGAQKLMRVKGVSNPTKIELVTSSDARIATALGATGQQRIYKITTADGIQYVAYGVKQKDGGDLLGRPMNKEDLMQSLLGSSVTALKAGGFEPSKSGNKAPAGYSLKYKNSGANVNAERDRKEFIEMGYPTGIWGDTSHKATKSDHNAGDALDIHTGTPNMELANKIIPQAKERGIKYIIHAGKIWSASTGKWSDYSKKDSMPHNDHVHISYESEKGSYSSGGGKKVATTTASSGWQVADDGKTEFNGDLNGTVHIKYEDGASYKGKAKDGRPTKGTTYYKDGSEFVGDYKDGAVNTGVLTKDGLKINYKNGKRVNGKVASEKESKAKKGSSGVQWK